MLTGRAAPEAAALFAPFAQSRAILVAVSGGPDSMALLWLAADWARRRGGPRIEAATVDHGLRPEGREEATLVAGFAGRLGAPHHMLEWTGAKPTTRLQERARNARYALLDACAARIGADTLLTAHHADDQAETILFRLFRGSGIAGLAGMAALTRRGDLMHGRPLLDVPKADLVALCAREAIDFVRDPSNADPRFARTAMRRVTALLAAEGLGAKELQRLAGRAAGMEAAVDYAAVKILADLDIQVRNGVLRADLSILRDAPAEILLRLLTRELPRRAAGARKPRLDRAEALANRLAGALAARRALRATLAGVLVRADAAGVLTLEPEANRIRGKVHANCTFSGSNSELGRASLGKQGRQP